MNWWDDDQDAERHYPGVERRTNERPDEVEPVVLTRKYAQAIDGIDLSESDVGARLPLNRREAQMLIAEGWAEPTPVDQRRRDAARSSRTRTA
jgi:hypothetical protein